MSEIEACRKCNNVNFAIARDMKATRFCSCGNSWVPDGAKPEGAGAIGMFPLTKSLGLYITEEPHLEPSRHWVAVNDLERVLAGAQVVYGHVKEGKPNYWGPRENGQFNDTHEARILCIQELKPKEPCKHEPHPALMRLTHNGTKHFCKYCDVTIMQKNEWEELP